MLEHTEVKQWRWVPSSDVTDDCTRDTPNEKFNSETVPILKNHFSWLKILRITARVGIFLSVFKRSRDVGVTPIAEDLEWSKKLWCKVVQCRCFPTDFENSQKSKPNKNGIDSRITKMESISVLEKEPIILDGSHEYTKKIILHFHKLNYHHGVETIINNLKKDYWIPRIRSMVKNNN
ncbi:hypothetical protein JTB14_019304 [Gonioctena quinquepunctata]|nr:hypothetical protein JTB14_019304 [Gonioctena quinquepunctata]